MARKTSHKRGIAVRIPGFGERHLTTLVSDYTGTLAYHGELVNGVKERLLQLSEVLDIHVITADTGATAKKHLGKLPLSLNIIKGKHEDAEKREYLEAFDIQNVVVLGNGGNDRLMLQEVKEKGGLAICVDCGEGSCLDALIHSHVLIHGPANALDLLLQTDRLVATLRF